MIIVIVMIAIWFGISLTATGYHRFMQNEDMGIIIPNFDKRRFYSMHLDNQMEVVLISDPNTKSASAAVSVGAGSNANTPLGIAIQAGLSEIEQGIIPGLAHLLEHMLFLGSSKYKEQSLMGKLVNIGGGYTNAYTSEDETNYYFVSGSSEFEESLEIFSWFFKDPLLDPKSIEKEVQNVNSEHRKNMNNDDWRSMNLLKIVADSNSEYHTFNTGNTNTLWNMPEQLGIDMSKKLREIYTKFYSANLMKLVMISNHPIEQMQKLANDKFSNVSNTNRTRPVCKFPYEKGNWPKEIRFLPTGQKHLMTLVFPIKHHGSNQLKYLTMLLDYEGMKSLSKNLKLLGYIHEINVGYNSFEWWSFLDVEFSLTDKGLANYEFVIKSLFVWVRYIKNMYSSPGVWSTMKSITELDFTYMHDKPGTSDSSVFAKNMQKFPFRYIYTGDEVIFKKDDVAVNYLINQLTLDHWIVVLSSPSFGNQNDKLYTKFNRVDQYYGTQYTVLSYTDNKKEQLINPMIREGKLYNDNTMESIDIHNLEIPVKNKYIPKNLEMVCPDRWLIVRIQPNYINECSEEAFKADGDNIIAKLISANEQGEMWFKQDRSFNVPVVNINIRLETDKGNVDLLEAAKLYFFESLLGDWIVDNLFDALLVSYTFSFTATNNGIEISISGYNDKIAELTKHTLLSFRNLKMEQADFDRVKDKFVSDLMQEKQSQPYHLAFTFTKTIIQEHGHTFDEILSVGQKLNLSDVQSFHSKLFDKVYVKSLVHGNMASEEAIEIKSSIDSLLNFGVLENVFKVKQKVHILDGPYAFTYHLFNKDEEDSAIFNSYQVVYLRKDNGEDLRSLMFLEMLSSLISNFAYEYLRTDRMLGYIVSCNTFAIGRSAFLYVVIQGNKEAPAQMDNQIENMLREFYNKELQILEQGKFDTLKQSISMQLKAPDESLQDRTARMWKEIVERDKDFKLREKLLKQLEEGTLEQFIQFYKTNIIPEDPTKVHKLSVQFYSPRNHPVLPTEFPDAFTPYKQINQLNSTLVESQF